MADITTIDPNFKASALPHDDIVWHDALDGSFSLHGLYDPIGTKRYTRLPLSFETDARVNAGVQTLMFHTAGGRIRFKTDSPYIALAVELPQVSLMSHMPLTGSSGCDIYLAREGSSDARFVRSVFPSMQSPAYSGCVDNPYPCAEVTVNLPLYNAVSRVYIGLKAGASIDPPRAFTYGKPVLYYGSSITQGGCASRPGNNYMNHISRWLDCDFYNLGFSGSAKGELCVADFIASLDLSAFVMDYDANAKTYLHLAATHYLFYRRIREKHPNLPIIFISYSTDRLPPYKTPAGIRERRDLIMRNYVRGVESGDHKLAFVDGSTLYGDRDTDASTVDTDHPNDLGFYRFAQRVYPAVRSALEETL